MSQGSQVNWAYHAISARNLSGLLACIIVSVIFEKSRLISPDSFLPFMGVQMILCGFAGAAVARTKFVLSAAAFAVLHCLLLVNLVRIVREFQGPASFAEVGTDLFAGLVLGVLSAVAGALAGQWATMRIVRVR